MLQELSRARRRSRAAAPASATPTPAALLPDQQGAVVAAGSQPRVRRRARRPSRKAATSIRRTRRKAEVQRWIDSLTGDEKARGDRLLHDDPPRRRTAFMAVPYSVEYQGELARAASLLREAAALTSQPTLKTFLTTRADAFLTDDYYASDVAWMELDASIEPTIGPYEVYEDEWFGYKAAFEAFITIRDEAESKKLAVVPQHLQDSRTRCRSIRSIAIRSSARSRRSASSTSSSAPATATAACRPPRSTCRTTSASIKREGHQARHAEEHAGREVQHGAGADQQGGARAPPIRRTSRSTRSSRTS